MRYSKFLKGLLVAVFFLSVPVWGHATPISQSSIKITELSMTVGSKTFDFNTIGPVWTSKTTDTNVSDPSAAGAFASAEPFDVSSRVEIYDTIDPAVGVVASATSSMANTMPIQNGDRRSVNVTFSLSYEAIFNVPDPDDGGFYAKLEIYAPDAGLNDAPLHVLAVSEDDPGSGTMSETFSLIANDFLTKGVSLYAIELSTAAMITVPPAPVTEPTPEPATFLLLSAGLGGLMLICRRRQQA